MKRRQFITCTLGAVGAGALGWKVIGSSRLHKVTERRPALGSMTRITVYTKNRAKGEEAIAAAFEAIEEVESVMSLYRDDSQVSRLNRIGVLEDPSLGLLQVLKLANELSADTDGAFDVTVQPLWELHSAEAFPTPEKIAEACKRIDWRRVLITSHGVQLEGDTQITLNGIAQGHAADVARQTLIEHGIQHAILDTGEVSTIGETADKDLWTVGIKHPRQAGFLGTAQPYGRCVATSGDYETNFADNPDTHHLFNPKTGVSANDCSSVSVMAPTAMEADALSTACFVLGAERGMDLILSRHDTDALFVTKDGTVTHSAGFIMS